MKYTELFWDFDGTLYDSYPQIAECFQKGLRDLGQKDLLSDSELMHLLKKSVGVTGVWCGNKAGIDPDVIIESYAKYHRAVSSFPIYRGAAETLNTLSDVGCRHYLYTHRDSKAVHMLERDGLWHLFSDAVLRTDGFPDKPDPSALNALIERNRLDRSRCLMIGDRDIDILAGHNAGIAGALFDPDGYWDGFGAELTAKDMAMLCSMITRCGEDNN